MIRPFLLLISILGITRAKSACLSNTVSWSSNSIESDKIYTLIQTVSSVLNSISNVCECPENNTTMVAEWWYTNGTIQENCDIMCDMCLIYKKKKCNGSGCCNHNNYYNFNYYDQNGQLKKNAVTHGIETSTNNLPNESDIIVPISVVLPSPPIETDTLLLPPPPVETSAIVDVNSVLPYPPPVETDTATEINTDDDVLPLIVDDTDVVDTTTTLVSFPTSTEISDGFDDGDSTNF